jgi:hypothetical protein
MVGGPGFDLAGITNTSECRQRSFKGRPPPDTTDLTSSVLPKIPEGLRFGIAQSAEGATQPSPDREVGESEEYDGEPRRVRHNREKGLNTIVKLRTKPHPSGLLH